MKIIAAVLDRSGGHPTPYATSVPLALREVVLDPPGAGELLIRIDAAGLCHSDLSVVNGDRPRPMPMVIGHEATGIVEALGTGCDGVAVGDRVVLAFLPACGHCPRCLAGEIWLCGPGTAANGRGALLSGACRLHGLDGAAHHHHLGISAFASHAVVDARSAVRVDADIPSEIAALFGCAVLTGVGAVLNAGALRPGENVVIHGLGGVGLSALLGARAGEARVILAIDPSADKRRIAQELGAHACAPEDADAMRDALFPEGGADLVVETVGHAAVLRAAIASGRRGSRIVTVGLPHPDQTLDIPALLLVAEAKTLIGSYLGSCVPARDIPRFIAMWKAGQLPVERLLTSVGPLHRINDLLDEMDAGRAIRQIVKP